MSRTKLLIACTLAATALSGCTETALDNGVLSQGSSITLIQEEMILNNLAMLKQRPHAIPWHVKITSGTVTIDDTISPSFSYAWAPVTNTLSLAPSRSVQLQWNIVPVTDDAELTSLASRYRGNLLEAPSVDPTISPPSCVNSDGSFRKFSETFVEGDARPTDQPYGEFDGTYIWVRDSAEAQDCFDKIVKQTLDAAPVTASDRGLLMPGAAVPPIGAH